MVVVLEVMVVLMLEEMVSVVLLEVVGVKVENRVGRWRWWLCWGW